MDLKLCRAGLGVALLLVADVAAAYVLKTPKGQPCNRQEECRVSCDNGHLAGSAYWNGSVWTDGVKSDTDLDQMARKIVAANGSACK